MFGFARPAGPNHWPKEDSTVKMADETALLIRGGVRY